MWEMTWSQWESECSFPFSAILGISAFCSPAGIVGGRVCKARGVRDRPHSAAVPQRAGDEAVPNGDR